MFGRKPSDNLHSNEESNMTGLIEISGCNNSSRQGDVVFVHGLGGHPLTTWHPNQELDNKSWLYWLGEDLKNLGIWTFGYKAEFSKWNGKAMSRFDQARSLLFSLQNEQLGEDKPLIFVTHSLGGLLVKEVLRNADTYYKREFIDKIKGIVFLATPHNGSHLANTVGILSKILQTTVSVKELEDNNPWLRDLDAWYRQKVNDRNYQIATQVYYEAWDTSGYKVVDEGSADPKLPDVMPVPVDADHITIAKPKSRQNLVYKGVKKFIADTFTIQQIPGDIPDDWIPYNIPWFDGSTMVVLPIKPEGELAWCIGKHPVTNTQYKRFVEETGEKEPYGQRFCEETQLWLKDEWHPWDDTLFNDSNKPVVCIDCVDAENYCYWVNNRNNNQNFYSKTVLPPLFLWAFAAFGNFQTFKWRNRFILKEEIDNNTWLNQTKAVHHKGFAPDEIDETGDRMNPRGVSDMFGNIFEWTTTSDLEGLVLIGGSFLDDLSKIQKPFIQVLWNMRHSDLGFRVAAQIEYKKHLPLEIQQRLVNCKSFDIKNPIDDTALFQFRYSYDKIYDFFEIRKQFLSVLGPDGTWKKNFLTQARWEQGIARREEAKKRIQ